MQDDLDGFSVSEGLDAEQEAKRIEREAQRPPMPTPATGVPYNVVEMAAWAAAAESPEYFLHDTYLEQAAVLEEQDPVAFDRYLRAAKRAKVTMAVLRKALKVTQAKLKAKTREERLANAQRARIEHNELRQEVEAAKASEAQVARPELAAHYATARVDRMEYVMVPGRIVARHTVEEMEVANFSARIAKVLTYQDAPHLDPKTTYLVEICLSENEPLVELEVSPEELVRGTFVLSRLGGKRIAPGRRGAEMLAHALLSFATETKPKQEHVFGYTGWVCVRGQIGYVTRSGALTANGFIPDVAGRIPGEYFLPLSEGSADALALLELFAIEPRTVALPMLFAAVRSLLGPSGLIVSLQGRTNLGKTALVSLILSCFGAGFATGKIAQGWGSSGFILWKKLVRSAHAPIAIDDFKTTGTARDQRIAEKAEEVMVPHANGECRVKGTADGGDRNDGTSACVLFLTSETLVTENESSSNRTVSIELNASWVPDSDTVKQWREKHGLAPTMMDWEVMLHRGQSGAYARGMSAVVKYLAQRMKRSDIDSFQNWRSALLVRDREAGQALGLSGRTAEVFGALAVGMNTLLDMLAADVPEQYLASLRDIGTKALRVTASAHTEEVKTQNPATRFLELLTQALLSGGCHIKSLKGTHPEPAESWGWSQRISRSSADDSNGNLVRAWERQGPCIGVIDGDEVILFPASAYKSVAEFAKGIGEPFPMKERDLGRQLAAANALTRLPQDGRGKYVVRKKCRSVQHSGLAIHRILIVETVDEPQPDDSLLPFDI